LRTGEGCVDRYQEATCDEAHGEARVAPRWGERADLRVRNARHAARPGVFLRWGEFPARPGNRPSPVNRGPSSLSGNPGVYFTPVNRCLG
jgi:hypothetical protein